MSTKLKLNAKLRNNDLNPRQLRSEGLLPATVYGKGVESISVEVNEKDFYMLYRDNQDATITLDVDGKSYEVNVQNIQKNYATNKLLNIEFKIV